ncbi:MAG: ORF6N domain-containing protein [Chlorobiaceae bacterium]|nr:ORF6N domain-containing protein [Chlorobiaceae bacterium]
MENRSIREVNNREEELKGLIHTVRGVEVMFDTDLAALYGVETRVFNQAVKRNLERFPDTFRFQLTVEEYDTIRSQPVILLLRNLKCQSGLLWIVILSVSKNPKILLGLKMSPSLCSGRRCYLCSPTIIVPKRSARQYRNVL